VSLIHSLLKCLIIAMCCVFIYFELIFSAGKGSRPTTEISSKKGGKNIPFLDENIPYLEGRGGGRVPMALTKKIYPVLFLNFRYPLEIRSSWESVTSPLWLIQHNQTIAHCCRFFTTSTISEHPGDKCHFPIPNSKEERI
jgi:hypothetical protein